jgi:group I intron endonuclease
MNGVIYLLTNLANGKYYIGQTRDFSKRKWMHARGKDKTLLGNAIRKYGWNSFAWEILANAEVGKALDDLERLWIFVANSIDKDIGYNVRPGGSNATPSEETRKRMSEAQLRNPNRYWLGKSRPDTAIRNKIIFTGRTSWNAGGVEGPRRAKKKYLRPRKDPVLAKANQIAGLRRFLATPEGREKQKRAIEARWAKKRENK